MTVCMSVSINDCNQCSLQYVWLPGGDWLVIHHILNISKEISQAIGIIYKLRPLMPLKVLKNVYYSLVYFHIIYVIEASGSAFKTGLEKILVLQKRAMRLMTFNDASQCYYYYCFIIVCSCVLNMIVFS